MSTGQGLNLEAVLQRAVTDLDCMIILIREPSRQHELTGEVRAARDRFPGDNAGFAITVLTEVMNTLRELHGCHHVDGKGILPRPIEALAILDLLKEQLEVIQEVMGGKTPSCITSLVVEMYGRQAVTDPVGAVYNALGNAVQMLQTNVQAHANMR